MKKFRTAAELEVGKKNAEIFSACEDSVEVKLENFPKYVRRQHLKRFLAHYEIFKRVLPVKGSIVECGVFKGFGVMSWAKLSAMLEPENFTRRVYGFDTFEGFTAITDRDQNAVANPTPNALYANSFQELNSLIEEFDKDRFLGHMDKVHLVRGNACETIPRFVKENGHLVVSLLFLDFDLFEPTKVAIEQFVPRMPKGSIIAFDELDNPQWPGETLAVLESVGIKNLRLQRLDWDPYIGFAVIE
ncbi:TylF/MycF family methyltransferase [bacterium]|nr:TylF/MycF family methyltransferase [bacterium]